jgi:hypothetical protein
MELATTGLAQFSMGCSALREHLKEVFGERRALHRYFGASKNPVSGLPIF